MDYKAMWESLRDQLNEDLEFYRDGSQCSMMEAINGVGHAEDVLRKMATLESKYIRRQSNAKY